MPDPSSKEPANNECRELTFTAAIKEALDICLRKDPSVYLMGEGVTDPKGIFGTTLGLAAEHGADRVIEMPVSENGMTGIAIGSSQLGYRPVMMHQRVEFALYSYDQLVNNAAKWHYMYGGQCSIPLVVRLVVGRGWGQGAQHAQSLETVFAHVPGLKVVMPSSAREAKGLMISAIEDPNPVIYIEHRWLHGTTSVVPDGYYTSPLSSCRTVRHGKDVTIVATSFMVVEAMRAADALAELGIEAEIIDLAVLRPLNTGPIEVSVRKTGHLVCVDTGWSTYGVGAEVIARVVRSNFHALRSAPRRLGAADHPVPSTRALIGGFYPTPDDIVADVVDALGADRSRVAEVCERLFEARRALPADVPDATFTGPF